MRIIFRSSGTRAGIALALLFIASSAGMLQARPSPHPRKGAEPQSLLRQVNTASNAEFFYSNQGVLFNAGNGDDEGLFWPRGSGNSYIFGEGLWFATKKKMHSNSAEVTEGWSFAGTANKLSLSGLIANSGTKQLFYSQGPTIYVRQANSNSFKVLASFPTNITALIQLPNGNFLIGTVKGLYAGPETGPWPLTAITTQVNAISSFGVVCAGDSIYTPNSNGSAWTSRHAMGVISYLSSLENNWMILAASPTMIMLSRDTGKTWDTIPPPIPLTGAVLASNDSMVIATPVGFWKTTDNGAHWVTEDASLTDLNIKFIRSDDNRNFILINDLGVFTNTMVNGVFGEWVEKTDSVSWATSALMAAIDSGGSCHVVDTDGDIYTQWQSPTLVPGLVPLCDLGYNPNSGAGWYIEGEASQVGLPVCTDGADPNAKYISYVSPRYDRTTGSYIPGGDTVVPSPYYSWPVWDTSSSKTFEHNYYFGDYISDVTMRNNASLELANPQLRTIGKIPKPAMVSQEDIVNLYSDEDTTNDPEYRPNTGYPFGIDIQEVVYSWGYGRYRDMVFVRYKVKNSSNDTLFDSWIAPAFDPDLGAAYDGAGTEDANSYVDSAVVAQNANPADTVQLSEPYLSNPALLNMGYQYRNQFQYLPNGQQYGMVGFSFVETPVVDSYGEIIPNDDSAALQGYGPNSLFQQNQEGLATFRDWTIENDPSNDDNRYNFVSNGEHDTFNGVYGDQRLLMATGPFTLAPGKSAEATFVLTFADVSNSDYKLNFDALLSLTDFAHQVFGEVDSAQSGGSMDYFVNHFQVAPPSSVKSNEATSGLTMEKPYPNPFSANCAISYQNSVAGEASAIVTDVLGRTVQSFSLGEVSAGEHTVTIDGTGLSAGDYRVTVVVGTEAVSQVVVHFR